MAPPSMVTQRYRLTSMAAHFSSTGISLHSLRPHIRSIRVSPVNSSPHPGIAPPSLNSLPASAQAHGTCIPVQGVYGCSKDCLILIPFKLPQIRCITFSLKCFFSDSYNCPDVRIGPLLQFPHPPRAGPVLLRLLFFPLVPSSYQILCGFIYSSLLVRQFCLLSAGVLHALLCLKVYS